MVAKLGNIVGEHVKFDMLTNNVGQFGHTFRNGVIVKGISSPMEQWAICLLTYRVRKFLGLHSVQGMFF